MQRDGPALSDGPNSHLNLNENAAALPQDDLLPGSAARDRAVAVVSELTRLLVSAVIDKAHADMCGCGSRDRFAKMIQAIPDKFCILIGEGVQGLLKDAAGNFDLDDNTLKTIRYGLSAGRNGYFSLITSHTVTRIMQCHVSAGDWNVLVEYTASFLHKRCYFKFARLCFIILLICCRHSFRI